MQSEHSEVGEIATVLFLFSKTVVIKENYSFVEQRTLIHTMTNSILKLFGLYLELIIKINPTGKCNPVNEV